MATRAQLLLIAKARRRRAEAGASGSTASNPDARIAGAFDEAAPMADRHVTTGFDAAARGFGQGATANFADEMTGAAAASELPGWLDLIPGGGVARIATGAARRLYDQSASDIYDRTVAGQRRMNTIARAEHPVASGAGEIAGGVATALVPGGTAVRGASIAGAIGRGALESAAYGAASGAGAGETPGERIGGAASGAVVGGTIGAALPVAGGAASRLFRQRNAGPGVDELRTAANDLYDVADRAGVVITGPAFQRIAQNVAVRARNEGIDPGVHPAASAALTRLLSDASGRSGSAIPTLRHMDQLRQILRDAGANGGGDARLARAMVEGLDDNLARLQTRDIQSGNPAVGLPAVQEARQLWARMRKGEQIEQIFENARDAAGANYTQAGLETSLKQQFRAILRNPNQARTFTQEERDAMRDVVRGSGLERTLRLFGKFAPRGVISALPAIAAGAAVDLGTGAALAGGAELSRRAAQAMAMRNAERVGEVVRNGGAVARRGRSNLTPAIEQGLARGAVTGGRDYYSELGEPLRIYLSAGERDRQRGR